MRTNPFFDTWQFLIGATEDHARIGAFGYVFVALFLVLVAASLWIARANWRDDPAQRTGVHVATWACRFLIGCMWFQGCLWKLPFPVSGPFQYWTGELAEHAAFAFHRALAANVFVPYVSVIQPIVFLAELSFGISLMLGFGVRLFALLATGFVLQLWLGLYRHPNEWPWTYVFLVLLLVLFIAYAVGRSLGADALLRRRADKNSLLGRFVGLAG
jgi:CDP-diglyceride synthetase